MKHVIFLLCILAIPQFTKANWGEFSYVQNELNREFKTLNEISEQVDEQNLNYFQVMNANDLDTDFELASTLAVKPTLNKGKTDWDACALGFLCWPVGIFTVLIKDNNNQNTKESFCLGWATNVVLGAVTFCIFNWLASGPPLEIM